jgi:hypothetical protein
VGATSHPLGFGHGQADPGGTADLHGQLVAARNSRRHLLCELFDDDCSPMEGDPCVPIALVQVRGDKVTVDDCLVRPRIYSNQRLLDLILCLADKLDECCGHPTAPALKVKGVEFIHREAASGVETQVAAVSSPLAETPVNIAGRANAIRIRFNRALATDQHKPTTHGSGDPDFELHNVQVLPDDPLNGLAYVPGTLVPESPDTVRFDLALQPPYARGDGGWQKGRYRVFLRGTEDLPRSRQALADSAGTALDGEAIAPAGGVMSGDGSAGGDFTAAFMVGAVTPPPSPSPSPTPSPSPAPTPSPVPSPPPTPTPTPQPPPPPVLMHVREIEFLGVGANGSGPVIGAVADPAQTVELADHLAAIRISFDQEYAISGPKMPTIAGPTDANFERHNVQLRLSPELARRFGTFIAGQLVHENARTVRIDIARGTRLVNADGRWPVNLKVPCEIFLRGKVDATAGFPELGDKSNQSLDGEPKAPSGGVMSGDGSAGGDFTASFVLRIPG